MADAQSTIEAPLTKKQGALSEKKFVEVELGETKERVLENSPEHLALTQVFDTEKKYMFELAEEADQNLHPVIQTSNGGRTQVVLPRKKYPPSRNIILSSQIVWNGQRRNIRYYAGCTTIFVDKQPQDKDVIAQAINSTPYYRFLDGKQGWYGYERMLLLYMTICSWNVDSPFRTKTANGIFRTVNADKIADETTMQVDLIEQALKLAKDASEVKMKIHALYLGIPEVDWDSGNELTQKEIRALYRKAAADDPRGFIESYGNKSIEIKYYIDDCLRRGVISNKFNPNKATWGSKNSEICDISGLKNPEAIAQRLYEFSQSEDGSDFLIQLKSLYS